MFICNVVPTCYGPPHCKFLKKFQMDKSRSCFYNVPLENCTKQQICPGESYKTYRCMQSYENSYPFLDYMI